MREVNRIGSALAPQNWPSWDTSNVHSDCMDGGYVCDGSISSRNTPCFPSSDFKSWPITSGPYAINFSFRKSMLALLDLITSVFQCIFSSLMSKIDSSIVTGVMTLALIVPWHRPLPFASQKVTCFVNVSEVRGSLIFSSICVDSFIGRAIELFAPEIHPHEAVILGQSIACFDLLTIVHWIRTSLLHK